MRAQAGLADFPKPPLPAWESTRLGETARTCRGSPGREHPHSDALQWGAVCGPTRERGSAQAQSEPWAGGRTSPLGRSSLSLGTGSVSQRGHFKARPAQLLARCPRSMQRDASSLHQSLPGASGSLRRWHKDLGARLCALDEGGISAGSGLGADIKLQRFPGPRLLPALPSPPSSQAPAAELGPLLSASLPISTRSEAPRSTPCTGKSDQAQLTPIQHGGSYGNRVMLSPHRSIAVDLCQQHTLQPLGCQELLVGLPHPPPPPPPACHPTPPQGCCTHREGPQLAARAGDAGFEGAVSTSSPGALSLG